jgi:hypothetical protein
MLPRNGFRRPEYALKSNSTGNKPTKVGLRENRIMKRSCSSCSDSIISQTPTSTPHFQLRSLVQARYAGPFDLSVVQHRSCSKAACVDTWCNTTRWRVPRVQGSKYLLSSTCFGCVHPPVSLNVLAETETEESRCCSGSPWLVLHTLNSSASTTHTHLSSASGKPVKALESITFLLVSSHSD